MIRGIVTESLAPMVPLSLQGEEGQTKIQAIIDTGFSGYLCLAEEYVANIALEYVFTDQFELADGSLINKDVFKGTVIFDGRETEVFVIFTASRDSLIGASLLRDFIVTVDYPRRVVTVRRRRPRRRAR